MRGEWADVGFPSEVPMNLAPSLLDSPASRWGRGGPGLQAERAPACAGPAGAGRGARIGPGGSFARSAS